MINIQNYFLTIRYIWIVYALSKKLKHFYNLCIMSKDILSIDILYMDFLSTDILSADIVYTDILYILHHTYSLTIKVYKMTVHMMSSDKMTCYPFVNNLHIESVYYTILSNKLECLIWQASEFCRYIYKWGIIGVASPLTTNTPAYFTKNENCNKNVL